jgi:hypothetical protein
MTAMSDYMERKLVNHIFRDTSWTAPSVIYVGLVGLYNAAELEAGTITKELSGGSYARVSVKGDAKWPDPAAVTNGLTDNVAAIEFATASADWGHVSGLFISNASTAGDVLLYGSLTAVKQVDDTDQFVIAIGDLDITFA